VASNLCTITMPTGLAGLQLNCGANLGSDCLEEGHVSLALAPGRVKSTDDCDRHATGLHLLDLFLAARF
jgi:hypothetical protein